MIQRCYNTFDVANCDIKVNNTKSTDRGAIYILKGYLRHYTRKNQEFVDAYEEHVR